MVDGDSQRAISVHEMSVMIIEDEDARILKKAMNLHSMKVLTDTSIVTQAPDVGMQQRAPPLRRHAVLGKRRRSHVAQVLVALHHRQSTEAAHHCLQRTILANASAPEEARLQLFDGHEHCEEPIGATLMTARQYAPQVMQKEEEQIQSTCENGDEEKVCTTPTHRRRHEQEGLVCPAPPSKPASKPRQATPPYNKKFFVPNNLADLPPCFKSLFT